MLVVTWDLNWSVSQKMRMYILVVFQGSLAGLSSQYGGWVPRASIPRESGSNCVAFTTSLWKSHKVTEPHQIYKEHFNGRNVNVILEEDQVKWELLSQAVWKIPSARETGTKWEGQRQTLRQPERRTPLWHSRAPKHLGETLNDILKRQVTTAPVQNLTQNCQKIIRFIYSEREQVLTKFSKLLFKLSQEKLRRNKVVFRYIDTQDLS